MIFARLPHSRQEELVEHLAHERAWTLDRAREELEAMDDVGVAYVGVERRLAARKEVGYDPFAAMFEVGGPKL